MTGEPDERLSLPAEAGSVPVARHFLAELVARWHLGAGVGARDVELALSELVTNAIEHGAGPVKVRFSRQARGLQIDVTSSATGSIPRVLEPPDTAVSGRGLKVVDTLAAAWGHHDGHGDLTVWARFDL
jgi:anti-sigma regulatory factor (Ser/Thr protein kinase)